MHKKILLLLAVVLMALMTVASPALAAPGGNGNGIGQGIGGGDISHDDYGKHNAFGGGRNNNPHLDDCDAGCNPV